MRILHTSDWHLGQKFLSKDRIEEHQRALDWLRSTIIEEQVEVLLVSGDIFDIGNPPSYARKMYYQFLTSLHGTYCRHVVITGGNHDSPSMLNAPKELLEILNVYVKGAVTKNIQEEILELKDEQGRLELVVAAVPFLRDRDIRLSVAGETGLERTARVRAGIIQHFEEVGIAAAAYIDKRVPLLAMGHLYAKGAKASEKQNNIYIGDIENIEGKQFPTIFDYIALGHLHRAQLVEEQKHIRYSGSIIPLSFGEIQDKKSVYLLAFDKRTLTTVKPIKIPRFRALISIQGNLEKVKARLKKINEDRKGELIPWVEIVVELEEMIPNLDGEIREFAKDFWLTILKIRTKRQHHALEELTESLNLDDLTPVEVFQKKCDSDGTMETTEQEALVHTFKELENWMAERE